MERQELYTSDKQMEIIQMADLDLVVEENQENDTFRIDDDKKASWALRQYKALDREAERKKELVKEEIERLKAWLDEENNKIDKKKNYLSQHLDAYLYQLRLDDPKAKIETPFGTVSTRKSPAKWIYEDDKIIKFLHEADMEEFIRVKEEVDKTPLKKALQIADGKAYTEAGEEVEGISIEAGKENLVIKID